MSPARQELIRLALEMPEQAIATTSKMIVWICPGMVDLSKPMLGQTQMAILENLSVIGRDPGLRAQLRSALTDMKAGRVPPLPALPENVTELFPAGKVRP